MTTLILLAIVLAVIFFIYMWAFRGEYYNPDEIEPRVKLSKSEQKRYKKIAYNFANALANENYTDAFKLLGSNIGALWSPQKLKASYEKMIEYGEGSATNVEVIESMDDWPDKKGDDIGWAYVAIEGSDFTEAVTVIVSKENGDYRIRDIEWGRP